MMNIVILEVGRKDMSGTPELSLRESGWNVLQRREIQHHLHRSYFLDNSIQHRALESHPKEFSYSGICVGVYAKETASLPGSIHTQRLGCGRLAPDRSIWLQGLRSLHRLCVSSRLRALWASLLASPWLHKVQHGSEANFTNYQQSNPM